MSAPSGLSLTSGILQPVVCCLERSTLAAIELKYMFIAFTCRDQDSARGMRLAEASPDPYLSNTAIPLLLMGTHRVGLNPFRLALCWQLTCSPKRFSCTFALYFPVINFEQPLRFHITGQCQQERCLLLSKIIDF